MSIWGKIVGSAAGLMIGGPIGALLGAAAGHAYDALSEDVPGDDGKPIATPLATRTADPEATSSDGDAAPDRERPAATQHIAFTIGVIALAAKMAKVDGVVTRREIDAFRSFFHVPPEEVEKVGRFFDLAKRDTAGFEAYAHQVAGLFPKHPEVLEEVLAGLFLIASADDGQADEAKLGYLRTVSTIFGLGEARFRRVAASAGVELHDDPYAILDVMPESSDAEIRQAHRRLARTHHPDRMIARGLPPEAIVLANRKLAAINAAYDRIRKDRESARFPVPATS